MNKLEIGRNGHGSTPKITSTVLKINSKHTEIALGSYTKFEDDAESGQVHPLQSLLMKKQEAVDEVQRLTEDAANAKLDRQQGYKKVMMGTNQTTANGLSVSDALEVGDDYNLAILTGDAELMMESMPPDVLEGFRQEFKQENFKEVGKGGGKAKLSSPSSSLETRTSAQIIDAGATALADAYCKEVVNWPYSKKVRMLLASKANKDRLQEQISIKEKLAESQVVQKINQASKSIKEWGVALTTVYVSSFGAVHAVLQDVLGPALFTQVTRDTNAIHASVDLPADITLEDQAEIHKYKEVVHVLNVITTTHKGDTVTAAVHAREVHYKNAAVYKLGANPRVLREQLTKSRVAYWDIKTKAKDQDALEQILDVLVRIPRSNTESALYNIHLPFDTMLVSDVTKATVNELYDSLQAIHTSTGLGSAGGGGVKPEKPTTANAVTNKPTSNGQRAGNSQAAGGGRGAPRKGPKGGCHICQGDHYAVDCPDKDKPAEPEDMRMPSKPARIGAVFVGSATHKSETSAQSDDGTSDTSSEDVASLLDEDDGVVCGLCAAGAAPAGAREIAFLAAKVEDLQAEVDRMQATEVATARDSSDGNRGKPVHARGGASTLPSAPARALMDTGTPMCLTSGALENRVPHHKPLSGFNGQPSVSDHKGDAVRRMLCARTKATRAIRLPFWHVADAQTELVTPTTFAQCGHRFVMDPEGTRVEFSDGQTIWLENDCSVLWADASVGQVHVPTEKKKKNRKKKPAHPNGQ